MALAHPVRRRVGYLQFRQQAGHRWFAVRSNPRRVLAARSIRPAHRRSICGHGCSVAAIPDRPQPSMRGPMLPVKTMRVKMMPLKTMNPLVRHARICSFLRRCTSTCAWPRDRRGNTNDRPPVEALSGRRDIRPPVWRRPPWRYHPPQRQNWFPLRRRQISLRRISLNGLTWLSPVMIRERFTPQVFVKDLGRNGPQFRSG